MGISTIKKPQKSGNNDGFSNYPISKMLFHQKHENNFWIIWFSFNILKGGKIEWKDIVYNMFSPTQLHFRGFVSLFPEKNASRSQQFVQLQQQWGRYCSWQSTSDSCKNVIGCCHRAHPILFSKATTTGAHLVFLSVRNTSARGDTLSGFSSNQNSFPQILRFFLKKECFSFFWIWFCQYAKDFQTTWWFNQVVPGSLAQLCFASKWVISKEYEIQLQKIWNNFRPILSAKFLFF